MIEQIKHIEDLTPIHWFLAYATLVSKIFMGLALSQGTIKEVLNKKTVFTAFAHFLLIPVALIACTDTAMKTILPINYVTAVLIGFHIEMVIAIMLKVGELKSKNNTNENS